eukprot:TRINITY_DN1561_c0_g2_i1.p1 TRINITY_DN1561_c0_g2~~TRINITY_DN1561_c0_g2_i1.p1  ORF type:complete len:194 (+),score=22.81 TRINITY_DN1561_c0_g2_i1:202-783(+)
MYPAIYQPMNYAFPVPRYHFAPHNVRGNISLTGWKYSLVIASFIIVLTAAAKAWVFGSWFANLGNRSIADWVVLVIVALLFVFELACGLFGLICPLAGRESDLKENQNLIKGIATALIVAYLVILVCGVTLFGVTYQTDFKELSKILLMYVIALFGMPLAALSGYLLVLMGYLTALPVQGYYGLRQFELVTLY